VGSVDHHHRGVAPLDAAHHLAPVGEQAKYLDVGTIYDALAHGKEAIRVAVLILSGKPVDCPDATCLAKGRVTTQENIATTENLWSRQQAAFQASPMHPPRPGHESRVAVPPPPHHEFASAAAAQAEACHASEG